MYTQAELHVNITHRFLHSTLSEAAEFQVLGALKLAQRRVRPRARSYINSGKAARVRISYMSQIIQSDRSLPFHPHS